MATRSHVSDGSVLGTSGDSAPRVSHRRGNVGATALIVLTVAFAAFLLVPLAALYVRAPLRVLQSAQCCQIVREALVLSLWTSCTTTALAFIVGTPVAYGLARGRVPFKGFFETVIELPMTLPPVVAGVALLLAFGRNGYVGRYLSMFGVQLSFTTAAVIIAQFMVSSPFYVRTAISTFEAIPERFLQASRSLGAGPMRTFFRVVFPMSAKGLLAGLALTWSRAIGEFGATIMFAGNFPGRTQTMPLGILTTMQQNLHAGIVLSVVMLTVCVAVFAVGKRLTRG